MTGSIDILPPYDADLGDECIMSRKMLAEMFSTVSKNSDAGMSNAIARDVKAWLDTPEFESTCYAAEVDYRIMTAIFERQIYLGQNNRRETTATVIPIHKSE